MTTEFKMEKAETEQMKIEQIKKFDVKLKKLDDYNVLMMNLAKYLFLFFGCVFMVMPASDKDFGLAFAAPALYFLDMAMIFHLSPYLQIKDKGKQIPIYEKLKWMPVSKKDVIKVRQSYLLQFCIKVGIIIFFGQQLGALLSGCFNLMNICYPIVMWLLLVGSGSLYIYGGFRKL